MTCPHVTEWGSVPMRWVEDTGSLTRGTSAPHLDHSPLPRQEAVPTSGGCLRVECHHPTPCEARGSPLECCEGLGAPSPPRDLVWVAASKLGLSRTLAPSWVEMQREGGWDWAFLKEPAWPDPLLKMAGVQCGWG